MPYEIHFPNYSREQLTRIFLNMAGKAFDFDEPFREAAASFFGSVSDAQYKAKNFSNARLARNLYERGVGQGLPSGINSIVANPSACCPRICAVPWRIRNSSSCSTPKARPPAYRRPDSPQIILSIRRNPHG